MPFAEAEQVFGVATLRPLAGSRQVWSNWRIEGLPWEVAGPLLLARPEIRAALDPVARNPLRGHGPEIASRKSHLPQTDRSYEDLMADDDGRDAFRRLSILFKNKALNRKAWDHAVDLLRFLTPARRGKKAPDDKKSKRESAQ